MTKPISKNYLNTSIYFIIFFLAPYSVSPLGEFKVYKTPGSKAIFFVTLSTWR